MKLGIMEYMRYLGGSEHSKCVVEGENVINAGHLLSAGKLEETSDFISIYGLCVQSSSVDSLPHEVTGKLEDVESLEPISSTDRKCVWSTQKHLTKENYRPVPVDEMPCFQNKTMNCNVVVNDQDVRNFFCSKLPNSAIAKHRTGRREQIENPSTTSQYNNSAQNSLNTAILNNSCQSPLMLYMSSLQVPILRDCCKKIIASFESDDIDVAINVPQHSVDWKKMRKHRITGSRCYEIFTYSKDDWKNKALKYFNQPSLNNKFVKHGLKFESRARDVFIKISKMDVVECGLIIPEANKWLGYSPDGIIFFNGQPLYLLEIKCLFEGKVKSICEVTESVKYIKRENGQYSLKKQHKYYGQIQMGMAVLNLLKTYFVLYASYDDSILVIEVEYDFHFSEHMLTKIKQNYFEKMLHAACEHK